MPTHIEGCTFVGVQFDETAVDVIDKIADSLIYNSQAIVENAKASKELITLLRANNVHIEAMIKIAQPSLNIAETPIKPTKGKGK